MRAPRQVLVFPFYVNSKRQAEYAIFLRADADFVFWQGIAGGAEDDESPLTTARRETFEESGITPESEFISLSTITPIPVLPTFIKHQKRWGEDTTTIPEYSFGVRVYSRDIRLSDEHTEYRWVSLDEACRLLYWNENKTVLRELNEIVQGFINGES